MDTPAGGGHEEALLDDQRRKRGERLRGRDGVVHGVGGLLFVLVAAVLPFVLETGRDPDVVTVVALVVALGVASLIEFEVGSGTAVPTQLVLVPMLFALPPAWVPACAAAGYVLGHAALGVARHRPPERALVLLSCSWYAVGPALVMAALGEPAATLGAFGVLLAAVAAQIACDAGSAIVTERLVSGTPARVMLPFLAWVYLVDVTLVSVAFLTAVATAPHPALATLVMPLAGLLWLFARERQKRIDHADELSEAYARTALLLGDVVEADDAYTGSHSRGVVDLVEGICEVLDLDPGDRQRAKFTALLHDVGKINITNKIINKPGKLTPEERTIIETHTVEGERILERVGGMLGEVGRLVRSCHEHWDGGGYPDGLAGEAIPLVARIVCTADAYSAMTTDRSYRKARPPAEAVAELRRCAGTQFDGRVVEALAQVVEADDAVGLLAA
jgi:hypothetical protein